METVKTLLRTPELIRALKPLVSIPISSADIFRLIGEGRVKPCGYIQRIPVFDIAQIGPIAKEFRCKETKSTALKERNCG